MPGVQRLKPLIVIRGAFGLTSPLVSCLMRPYQLLAVERFSSLAGSMLHILAKRMSNNATFLAKIIVLRGEAPTGEKLSQTTTQVKDKVSDLGRTAADKIDENRDAAAGGLDKAAATLHEKAESLARRREGHRTGACDRGKKLSSTADYVGNTTSKR